MEEKLIAPRGMNCGVCINYLSMKKDLHKQGSHRRYCAGCIPRGKNCTYMKGSCNLLEKGLVRFCLECDQFPCKRLKALDKRYRDKYHMSMIENLEFIQEHGIERFLEKENAKWRCPDCGDTVSCHTGLCMKCGFDMLRQDS